jgi:RNA polymerase sigma factor (sigma-70 family)
VKPIKKFLSALKVISKVTATFVGLLFWLTFEYAKECVAQVRAIGKVDTKAKLQEERRKNDLSDFIAELSQYEQSILLLRYQAHLEFSEIAEEMNLTTPETVKIHNNAILKIRHHRQDDKEKIPAKT